MSSELPDLDPDIRALFEAEREVVNVPRQAVVDDLASRLGPMLAAPRPGATHPASSSSTQLSPSDVSSTVASSLRWKGLALFALGGVVGGGVVALARPPQATPQPEIRVVERIVERPSADAAVPAPVVSHAPITPPVKEPLVASAKSPRANTDAELSRERALIEAARSAMLRRDVASALDATDEHARAFPKGRLSEEREAIAIQALVELGRHAEARERAERFRARFPNGLLLPLVEAATGQAK